MELNVQEKELLVRVFSHYYKFVHGEMATADNVAASDEDYAIRSLAQKLDFRNMFSEDVKAMW